LEKPLRVCRACGLEAWTKRDLELFKKRTGYPYNRLTICKRCVYTGRKKPPTPYIRKCYVCGYEAHTTIDLGKFSKHKNKPLGYAYICKKCSTEKSNQRINKTDKFIKVFRERSGSETLICNFCERPIFYLRGRKGAALDIHSLDGNHENWDPINKVSSHRSCHARYHNVKQNNIQYLEKWRRSKCLRNG